MFRWKTKAPKPIEVAKLQQEDLNEGRSPEIVSSTESITPGKVSQLENFRHFKYEKMSEERLSGFSGRSTQSSISRASSIELGLDAALNPIEPELNSAVASAKFNSDFIHLLRCFEGGSTDMKRGVAAALRALSKLPNGLSEMASFEAVIECLVECLDSNDTLTEEHAVTTLMNLSTLDSVKDYLTRNSNGISKVVSLLKSGNVATVENAAATIFLLADNLQRQEIIGKCNSIPYLLNVIREGLSIRGKKDAALALFNLTHSPYCCKELLKNEGIMLLLESCKIQTLECSKNQSMERKFVAILINVARLPEGITQILENDGINVLVEILDSGSLLVKEEVSHLILMLAEEQPNILVKVDKEGREGLTNLSVNGTQRGKKKAKQILELIKITEFQYVDEILFSPGNPDLKAALGKAKEKWDFCPLISFFEVKEVELKRGVAAALRALSKLPKGIQKMAEVEEILRFLFQGLDSEDRLTSEYAVTTLLNLCLLDSVKDYFFQEQDRVNRLVNLLTHGSNTCKENASATIFLLADRAERQEAIGRANAILPLLNLLKEGSLRGKKDASLALFHLTVSSFCCKELALNGGVEILLRMTEIEGMEEKSLAILAHVAKTPEGRDQIIEKDGLSILIDALDLGSVRCREDTTSILLLLSLDNPKVASSIENLGARLSLYNLSVTGTPRGNKKAQELLELMDNFGVKK